MSYRKKAGTVSLRDVALAAGVSRMTASRAFKKDSQINPDRRAKILATAEKIGYKPDLMVSQIMSNFASQRGVDYRDTIAVLWWPERWTAANLGVENYDAKILRGLKKALSHYGSKSEHINLAENTSSHSIDRILTARNIQGIIITPPRNPTDIAPVLNWNNFSTVSIGKTLHKPRFHCSRVSHYEMMVITLNKLINFGCEHPCLLVSTGLEQRMDRAYTAAFMAWNKNAEGMIWRQDKRSKPGLKSWIKSRKPDVVLADTYDWRQYLPEPYASKRFVALNVPERDGDISGIFQNTELLAEYAVDLLMRVRLRKQTGIPEHPQTSVCDGIWVDGKSFQPMK